MAFLKGIKKIIHQLDLFCSSQLLRYNSQTQYKTLTGGLLSLSIIVVIIVGFASMISDTLERTSITSSLTTIKQSDPPLAFLVPGSQNMFMLGFSIQPLDLTFVIDLFDGPQFFYLKMNLIKLQNGVPSYTPIAMQQCTREHWSMMPDFNQNFDTFQINKWACLPLNQPQPIQGSYTSQLSYQLQIHVFKCRNSTENNHSCASQQQIDGLFNTYKNFYITYNYINPVINTNLQDYISYYIQGNDYVIVSKEVGAEAWVFFSDYQIQSDNSILPFSQIEIDRGCIVEQKAINHPYGVYQNSALASVYLAKSANSLKYRRSVQKISAVFSYIGGLVGAITAVLFFINIYTNFSLQVTIGLNLFEDSKDQHQKKDKEVQNFNFYGFARLTIYRFLRLVGWDGSWQIPERLQKYQDEAVKQLDVQLLLKRLIKLQACMTHLFSKEQLQQIREQQPITMENARRMRSLLLKNQNWKDMERTAKVTNAEMGSQSKNEGMELSPYKEEPSHMQSASTMMHQNIIHGQHEESKNQMKIKDEDENKERKKLQVPNRINQNLLTKLQEIRQSRKAPKKLPELLPKSKFIPVVPNRNNS